MNRWMLRAAVSAAALVLASSASLRADETTFCNVFITTLPYTIGTQGHFCFDRNLSTAQTTGNAITINADFVLLDLNNFKLGGGSAGLGTAAVGIYSSNRSNITVRNGNIRGFASGIKLDGTQSTSAQNLLVENNVLDGNTVSGISVFGSNYTIRNNSVSNTGGSILTSIVNCFAFPATIATGIGTFKTQGGCVPGGHGEITGNTVVNTVTVAGGTNGCIPIYGDNGLVAQNHITTKPDPLNWGIVGAVCRDNTAIDIAGTAYYVGCALVGVNSDN